MLSRRLASTAAASAASSSRINSTRKIVLVGTGFLASYIVRSLVADPRNRVQLVSRNPQNSPALSPQLHDLLISVYNRVSHLGKQILPPKSYDLTSSDPSPLKEALEGADAVVSMVGLLVANEQKMIAVQQKGAEDVARLSAEAGVGRLVLVSAIGADKGGVTPYQRTKAAAEEAFLQADPKSTIIRPSIMFGPGDSFFTRFATLAKFLPFLPVFGGGVVRFQPVYAGDVARAIEICCRDDPRIVELVGGKIIEAGGPEVFSYREIMQLVLKHSGLQGRRLILSLPYWVGMVQGFLLEKLPESIFTVTRDQIRQLRNDNVVTTSSPPPLNGLDFEQLLATFPSSLPSSAPPGQAGLTSVHKSLPTYLGPQGSVESGKRKHGRSMEDGLAEARRLADASKKK